MLTLKDEVNPSDLVNSASVVLCCSLSLTDSTSRKALKKIAKYLPSFNQDLLESSVKKALKISITKLFESSSTHPKALKTLVEVLNKSIDDGPHLGLYALSALVKWSDPKFGTLKKLWTAIGEILTKWMTEKRKVDATTMQKHFAELLTRVVEWFGTVSLAGAVSEFDSYEAFLKVFQMIVRVGKFDSIDQSPVIFTLAMLFTHVSASSDIECYKELAGAIMNGMIGSLVLRDTILDQVSDCRTGNHTYSTWMAEQNIDETMLAWTFMTRALQYASFGTQLNPNKWMRLLFEMLPERWTFIQKTTAYTSLLELFAQTSFKLMLDTRGGAKPTSVHSVSEICQSFLFAPHPLLSHLSLDLWCLIIRSSSNEATIAISPSLGLLAKHFVQTHFSSSVVSPMTLESLKGLHNTRVTLKSIIRRVLESLPMYHRPEFDSKLKKLPLFLLLEGGPTELEVADLVLIDIIPWDLMSVDRTGSAPRLAAQLIAEIQRNQSLRLEPSIRSLLVLRALHRVYMDIGAQFSSDTHMTILRAVTALITNIKNSTVPMSLDGDSLAAIIDLLSMSRILFNSNWKSPFINLSDKISTMPSVAKVALVQFISACYSDPNTNKSDIDGITASVGSVFDLLLADREWTVASEAAVAYFICSNRGPVKLSKPSTVKDLVSSYSSEGSMEPSPETVLQLLRVAMTDSSHTTLLDSLISFKMSLNRFGSTLHSQKDSSILQELAQVNDRLTRLEGSLAVSKGDDSVIIL